MSLDTDTVIERRRLKRRVRLWRALAILVVVGALLVVVDRTGVTPTRDHIAALDVKGVITFDRKREKLLDKLAEDEATKAVIVRIDSPGGTVVGGERLYGSLRRVAEKKPVVAVMGTVATSAGYMIALAADRIFANQGTVTGSIGVLLQTADVTDLLEKIGVKPEAIKTSPLKASPSPFEPLSEEAREATQQVVDDMHLFFLDLITDRRALSRVQVNTLADGRVFTGRQGVDNGMIDAIGGEREAKDWLVETRDIDEDLEIRDVSLGVRGRINLSAAQILHYLFGEKSLISERLTLDGLVSLWHGIVTYK